MSEKSTKSEKTKRRTTRLKIQDDLPIRVVGIESQRERKAWSPPQNRLHLWWARRPVAASRLAILGTVLPDDVDTDTLLRWIGVDPDNKSPKKSIAEHVREKSETVDDRDGLVYEHYGYRKSYKNFPEDIDALQKKVSETWGDLPTVLDATAGGGAIPLESLRYGFPTIANELNPVASVLLRAVMDHTRTSKDLSDDIVEWGERINSAVRSDVSEYFEVNNNERPLEYLWAHTVECPDCGLTVPLSPNWWVDKDSGSEGIAARPVVSASEDEVSFEMVSLPDDVTKSEYNPTDGTVSYGKGECPRCNVVIEGDEVKRQAQEDEFGFQLFGVRVERYPDTNKEKRIIRAPTETDEKAIQKAKEKVDSDPDLHSLLDIEIPDGNKTSEPRRYGITKWRNMFTPRQLLLHYTYLEKFNEVKDEIYKEYQEEEAEALLTFLSIAADKAVDYNSRLSSWHNSRTIIRNTFDRHDFSFKWSFAESNLSAEGLGYEWVLEMVVEAYDELRDLYGHSEAPTKVLQEDAANLPIDDQEVDAVVLDPPYYDNVMYSELSDFFYVWMKEYLSDVYPDKFIGELTEKDDEAVANPSKFEGVAGEGESKSSLAKDDYESKMTDIFDEMNRVLADDGAFTLMFTHKRTEAWDTLATALIDSEFVITATHPISTENPNSLHQAGQNSAESTILLTSEKRSKEQESATLWSEIKGKTRDVARQRAESFDKEEANFTKVDTILAAFGPTLEIFTTNYPVVDDEGQVVTPAQALDEARDAVRNYFIDRYLNEGVRNVDPTTEWYILAWLVFEAQRFPYDEARRLAIGVGEELSSLKKDHRMWRKRSGDVLLRPHGDRVQDVNKDPDNRSGRKPVDPDALSFSTALDKVHAAMHIYNKKGATEVWNWMNDRNCGSDPSFKATLEALLRVLPHDHEDWNIARDLAAGETGELLDLDLDADIFQEDDDDEDRQGSLKDF